MDAFNAKSNQVHRGPRAVLNNRISEYLVFQPPQRIGVPTHFIPAASSMARALIFARSECAAWRWWCGTWAGRPHWSQRLGHRGKAPQAAAPSDHRILLQEPRGKKTPASTSMVLGRAITAFSAGPPAVHRRHHGARPSASNDFSYRAVFLGHRHPPGRFQMECGGCSRTDDANSS